MRQFSYVIFLFFKLHQYFNSHFTICTKSTQTHTYFYPLLIIWCSLDIFCIDFSIFWVASFFLEFAQNSNEKKAQQKSLSIRFHIIYRVHISVFFFFLFYYKIYNKIVLQNDSGSGFLLLLYVKKITQIFTSVVFSVQLCTDLSSFVRAHSSVVVGKYDERSLVCFWVNPLRVNILFFWPNNPKRLSIHILLFFGCTRVKCKIRKNK